ncbi:ATP-dependent DNA ligase [Steroidobacter agaridevorans]|uniref:DNA ligase (ATP) n=1 Tax=Steroidobacter agaridevorans TaxID=2695856 RepID=A0A829YKH3_9GAMM|nr:ATP-dependent DNA ligase [Steroidobacter agaridevorans]GFE83815.1 ATP-dependent DNA ligase [Steroidobacter agaridevorans]GFE91597.1 ATP-dependent DNA ligase [Steroidobacter agaridevorans]
MRAFAALYEELDTTQSTNLKVAAMSRYFREAPPADAAWATYILSGRRLKRFIGPALLKRWLIDEAALPEWLIDEAYASVGDLAETIALLTAGTAHSEATADDLPLADWIEDRLLPLRDADDDIQRQSITGWWRQLPYRQCFLLNKLLTGELRVGVSQLLVTRALAEVTGIERTELAGRLMGEWQPGALFWQGLHAAESPRTDPAVPYPFFLASPLEGEPSQLGDREAWQAEWKWDGIRGQLIRRAGECHLWSRGEERITERFPEIVDAAARLPDGIVLDGEVVAWKDGSIQPFALLQQRIGRKKLTAAILATVPVQFLAYDLLELEGQDLRAAPLRERRAHLEKLLADASPLLQISPLVIGSTWDELAGARADSRQRNVEGLMLKALDSSYGTGRQRGAWWKWKIEPHSFDAVMIYAQPGQGRRSNLYTDYTFGVWREQELVPVAKAYSGLSNPEVEQLDRWIRAHTLEKFGPVRSVEPSQVFELAYEGIAASARHKSGIALRFPRILRWRADKPASEADTLANLQAMLMQAPDEVRRSS